MLQYRTRGSVTAAQEAHNLQAGSSTLPPATTNHTVHGFATLTVRGREPFLVNNSKVREGCTE